MSDKSTNQMIIMDRIKGQEMELIHILLEGLKNNDHLYEDTKYVLNTAVCDIVTYLMNQEDDLLNKERK